jgi:hypothetical protein
MAVVGKGFAIVQSGPVKISGFMAWLAWAFIHIQFLALGSMRVSVFVQWVWTFLTGSRGSRLIVNHYALRSTTEVVESQSQPAPLRSETNGACTEHHTKGASPDLQGIRSPVQDAAAHR